MVISLATLRDRVAAGAQLAADERRGLLQLLEDAAAQEPRAARIGRRDGLVRELASRHFPGLTTTAQAIRISALASRYAAGGWLRDREHLLMPGHLRGRSEGLLWQAFKLDVVFPFSAGHIARLLK